MKKFVFSLFVAVFVALSTSVGYAANWKWIASSDTHGYFFDTESIRYGITLSYKTMRDELDTRRIAYWLKVVYTDESSAEFAQIVGNDLYRSITYSIASQNISIPNNSITTHSITFYDKDGKIIDAYKKDFFEEIIPDSYGYTISETIRNYAKEHHDEVVRNTYGN